MAHSSRYRALSWLNRRRHKIFISFLWVQHTLRNIDASSESFRGATWEYSEIFASWRSYPTGVPTWMPSEWSLAAKWQISIVSIIAEKFCNWELSNRCEGLIDSIMMNLTTHNYFVDYLQFIYLTLSLHFYKNEIYRRDQKLRTEIVQPLIAKIYETPSEEIY